MNNEKKSFRFPVTGVSSLLIIFSVLCMTVFAMLSVSTANADDRLSQKAAQSVTDYYAADSQAEKIIAALRSGSVPEGVTADGDTYTFTCPASDSLELQVSVIISGSDYEIVRWQMVSTAHWQNDDSLNLWEGN